MINQIEAVENNKQKEFTYIEQIKRYNKAIKENFYYESVIITYAILEDRTTSMLYYLDVIDRKINGDISYNRKNKIYIKQIYDNYVGNDVRLDSRFLKKIYNKIDLLKSIFVSYKSNNDSIYIKSIKKKLNKIDIDKLLKSFDSLNEWCGYRNQIIHSLMDKKTNFIEKELSLKTEEAFCQVRFLDSQIKRIKSIK